MTGVIEAIIQGFLTGLGSAIGTFVALKYAVPHIENTSATSLREKVENMQKILEGKK